MDHREMEDRIPVGELHYLRDWGNFWWGEMGG